MQDQQPHEENEHHNSQKDQEQPTNGATNRKWKVIRQESKHRYMRQRLG